MKSLVLTVKDGAVRFEVRAKPRASRSAVVGEKAGALEVRLAAAPVDGAANEELIALLARALGLGRSSVALVRGETSKTKLVAVRGLDEAEVRARLQASARA